MDRFNIGDFVVLVGSSRIGEIISRYDNGHYVIRWLPTWWTVERPRDLVRVAPAYANDTPLPDSDNANS